MVKRFKFTKSEIAKLPLPAKNRDTYYDEIVPKLTLRITPTGTRTFYVVKRVSGEMVWLKLGVFPDMTTERAREAAERALGEIASGNNPAEARRVLKEELTLSQFFEDEYGPRHGAKLRAWADYQQMFRDYIARPIGGRKLSAVTREQVTRIVSDAEKAGKSGSTVNHIKNLISGIYRQAIEWGYATSNPASGIRGRKGIKRDRFLLAHELPRFFTALADEPNDTVRDYVLISLLTGARRGNVLAMRWDQIRLDECIWHIPRTKNDDPQNVPLSPEATEVLNARKGLHDSPWVFPGSGKDGHLKEPKSGWRRILDRDELYQLQRAINDAGGAFTWPLKADKPLGHKGRTLERLEDALERARRVAQEMKLDVTGSRLTNLRIHDLRRTLGSWQAKTGASLVIIGKSLNHKSPSATAIYARLDLDPIRQSVNTATAAMIKAGSFFPAEDSTDQNDRRQL